jgi:hypothetical protein
MALSPAAVSWRLSAPALAIRPWSAKEALAWTLREIGWPQIGNLIGLAAGLALPSVILMMMFGQTRIFFVMSRDGLLPAAFSKIHPKFNTARHHHPDGCVRGLVLRVLSRSACWRTFRIRARCSLSRRCRSRC